MIQVRVSDDYHPGGEQWRIGVTSLFVGALGMRPFKDTFWTVKNQPGDSSGFILIISPLFYVCYNKMLYSVQSVHNGKIYVLLFPHMKREQWLSHLILLKKSAIKEVIVHVIIH